MISLGLMRGHPKREQSHFLSDDEPKNYLLIQSFCFSLKLRFHGLEVL